MLDLIRTHAVIDLDGTFSKVVPIVLMQDAPVHTEAHPFCRDLTCPCHEKFDFSTGMFSSYYVEHIRIPYLLGLLTTQEATRIYYCQHI